VPDEVMSHSRLVAELARILGVYLKRAGLDFNFDLIKAGGYLHEFAKAQTNGTGAEAGLLQQMGYARVFEVLFPPMGHLPDGVIDEADLVRVAERSIENYGSGLTEAGCGTCLNTHRYFFENPASSEVNRADLVGTKIEKILGFSLRSIIQKHKRGLLAASVQGIRNVYLLVHGAVGFKTEREYTRSRQIPLCSEGIQQAGALKDELSVAPLSRIYCSDFSSAVQTAKIVAEPHGLEIEVRCDLGEIDAGYWSGLPSTDIQQLYREQYGKDMLNFRPQGGETLFECTSRIIPAFYDILNSTSGNMAIIGHPIANRVILCQVLGFPLESLFELDQGCGSVNHIYCDGQNMRLESLNGADRSCSRFN
jgi:probable phosphoglycerate mutase